MGKGFWLTLTLIVWCKAVSAKPLDVVNKSGLNFGSVVAGSGPTVIPPGNNPSSPSAMFEISGDKNTAYTILLPVSATLVHTVQSSYSIDINNFASNPPAGNNGFLPDSGKERVWVGATATIPFNTLPGSYQGSFTLEVIY